MEERLDDALNVLRNHCTLQLGASIENSDGSPFEGTPPSATGSIPQDNSTSEPPTSIKLERIASNPSKILLCL